MHFMFFEDMKKVLLKFKKDEYVLKVSSICEDLRGAIKKVASFLNKIPTDEQLDKITEHLKFDNFEKNESVNNESGKKMGYMNPDGKFIRKGIIWITNTFKKYVGYMSQSFFQAKRAIGKIILAQSWTLVSTNGLQPIWLGLTWNSSQSSSIKIKNKHY